MENKVAFITGITGQDGSYLAELLLSKGYLVHGLIRRSSTFNTQRLEHLYEDSHTTGRRLRLHYGDLTDSGSLQKLIGQTQPDEVYHLGAQSHVAVSFDMPEYTAEVTGLGTLRLLEALRSSQLMQKTRFYQASSSELFGSVRETPQKETTPFYPRSPYAVAKLFAYWSTVNYREAYGLFACNGVLFNHESKRRGETFVTRKITRGLSRVIFGLDDRLYLGNLDSMRDWGHAKDYVEMQWMMLQAPEPKDYVIATGNQYSIRWFVEACCEKLGIQIEWTGIGKDEKAVVTATAENYPGISNGDILIEVDPRYYRPSEVESLLGDASLAAKELGWIPKMSIHDLIDEMLAHDLSQAKRGLLLDRIDSGTEKS